MSRFKTARKDYDTRTASSLNISYDDEYVSPKLFLHKFFSKNTSHVSEFEHNLGYTPSGFAFRKLNSKDWCHGIPGYDCLAPFKYFYHEDILRLYKNKIRVGTVYDTNMNTDVDLGTSVLLYLDRIDTSEPNQYRSLRPRVVVAKQEHHAKKDHPIFANIDTRFDTFKIFKTATLTLNAPSVTLNAMQKDERVVSFTHGLGYAPIFTPFVPYQSDLPTIYFSNTGTPTTPTNVNVSNLSDYTLSNHIGTGNSYSEIVKVWVDDQKIYLGFERESFYGPLTLPVRNIIMKSTIFYNPIDEEFDLR